MLKREEWLHLARKLDWDYSYVSEEEVFPPVISGRPWLPHSEWRDWEESFKTSYREYVDNQHDKDLAVYAVRDAVGRLEDRQGLSTPRINGLKVHAAALPLAEFTGVIGNLRGARFGRDSAWRTMATFGALDEFRHTHIPLLLMHELVRWDSQFDWTHKFYHTNNWFAVLNLVIKPMLDELFMIHLGELALQQSDHLLGQILYSLNEDCRWHRQWSQALVKMAMQDTPSNRDVLQRWIARWYGPSLSAIDSFGCFFANRHPDTGASWNTYLNSMGLEAPAHSRRFHDPAP